MATEMRPTLPDSTSSEDLIHLTRVVRVSPTQQQQRESFFRMDNIPLSRMRTTTPDELTRYINIVTYKEPSIDSQAQEGIRATLPKLYRTWANIVCPQQEEIRPTFPELYRSWTHVNIARAHLCLYDSSCDSATAEISKSSTQSHALERKNSIWKRIWEALKEVSAKAGQVKEYILL